MIVEMSKLEIALALETADSFSESEDRKHYKEFYEKMSPEEQLERNLINAETYDALHKLRHLKEEGII